MRDAKAALNDAVESLEASDVASAAQRNASRAGDPVKTLIRPPVSRMCISPTI